MVFLGVALHHAAITPRQPNFIVVFRDNFGCGGIEPFRSTIHRTPHYNATMKPQTMLFHLLDDMGRKKNMAAEHPDVVTRLAVLTEIARNDLGDKVRRGVGLMERGRIDHQPWSQLLRN